MIVDQCFHLRTRLPAQKTKEHASVMVVGSAASGKKRLSRRILDLKPAATSIHIRYVKELPLSPSETSSTTKKTTKPRIDAIIFVIDMTSTHSFAQCAKSCKHLPIEYYADGRVAFVATKFDQISLRNVTVSDIIQLADMYCTSPFFVNLINEKHLDSLVYNLLHTFSIVCGYQPHVSPCLLETPRHYRVTSTYRNQEGADDESM